MHSLLQTAERERARRRRMAILCLGALGRPATPAELRGILGEGATLALDDAAEHGYCERGPGGDYRPSPRCRLETGIVLTGTDEISRVMQALVPLASTPERALLLRVASDPLGEGLEAAEEGAKAQGLLGAMARALSDIARGAPPQPAPLEEGEEARDVFAAVASAAHVLVRTRPEISLALIQWGMGPEGFEGRIGRARGFLAGVVTQVLYDLGDREGAIAFSRAAQKALPGPPSAFNRLLLMSLEGHLLADLHRLREARQVFSRVELLARAEGYPEFLGIARIAFGTVAFREGQTEASVELFQSALELVKGSTRYEVLALHCLAHAWAKQGRHKEAQEALSETVPLLDSVAIRLSAYANAISYDCFMGDLPRAKAKLEELERLSPKTDHGALALALSTAWVKGAGADWEGALAQAASVREIASSRPAFAVALGCMRASCLLRLGRADDAARELEEAAVVHRLHALSRHRAMVQTLDAEISLARGDLERARRVIRRAQEAKEALRTFDYAFRLEVAATALARASGDPHAAELSVARAKEAWERLTAGLDGAEKERFRNVADRPALLAGLGGLPGPQAAPDLPWLRGASSGFVSLVGQLRRVATSEVDVLLLGETGAGKELCARALHEWSGRKGGPFVAINCAATTDELLLSELFGHEKGAFTGALDRHIGRFERAAGGTLFLDEIGDISPRGQAALLRALQERTFERVGGGDAIRADVRVVAATNRDLAAAVLAREFREDLYYRLRGIQIRIPPLRDRGEDVVLLAQGFLEDAARERGSAPRRLSREAVRLLRGHRWPGNVRELRNAIRAADLIEEGPEVSAQVLEQLLERRQAPPGIGEPQAQGHYATLKAKGETLRDYLDEVEREVIRACLDEQGGNLAAAAAVLGLSRPRLSQIVNGDPVLRAHRRRAPLRQAGG